LTIPYILKQVLEHSQQHVEIFGAQYYLFTCFAIIYYGMPFHFWSNSFPEQSESSILLRATAATLSFFLLFKDSLSERAKYFFPLYWFAVLTFCLPFASTYMLLRGLISFQWFFLSIFLLSILVDWVSFLIISFIGGISALFFVGLWDKLVNLNLSDQTFTAYTCVFAILIISLFLRNRDRVMYERIKAYRDLSGYIAHEIRKPLAFIRASCEGLEKYSPCLFDGYESAVRAGIYKNEINQVAFSSLKEIPKEFKKTSSDGLLFIEMLLMQTQHPLDANKESCFAYALDSITRVISRWEAGLDRVAKVKLNKEYDFKYRGISILVDHVLLELFRNSEHFIGNRKDAQIDIWCERSQMSNEIHFRDNGCGINDDDLKHVFKNGFSKRRYGTGIGLGFCKKVMKDIGGSMRVLSKNGEYTEVILSFPEFKGEYTNVAKSDQGVSNYACFD